LGLVILKITCIHMFARTLATPTLY